VSFLLGRGYRFIGEDEFYGSLANRSLERGREILLTFDDGYEEVYDVYMEHLAPRAVPLLVFLVTGYAGRMNTWDLAAGRRGFRHLSWERVAEMARAGARFGSHGVSHADLTKLPPRTLEEELVQSKRVLEDATGMPVRSFSYPFGRSDDRVRTAVKKAGYDGAFSLYPAHPNERIDMLALRRNGVYVIDTALTILRKIEPSPLFWLEEMKCRSINSLAVLTPILKRLSPVQGRRSRIAAGDRSGRGR
jgi:peptidoglycan/xylan/chitin deacetylase (PgdA/CDA1 family)